VPLAATVGSTGAIATEVRTGSATVITVELSFVTLLSVAFTKIPTVPAVVPAVNVTEAPLPVREPSVLLVRDQAYVMVPGQVELHVGLAVKGCVPLV
jgi:hypothetical protein